MSVKGANRTILDSATDVHTLAPGTQGGKKRVMVDSYECVNTAANTVILMGALLPKGAIVTDVKVMTDVLAADATVDVGDLEDPDRYIDGGNANAANTALSLSAIDGQNYTIDETDETNTDRQITVKVLGNTVSGTIKIAVEYAYE